MVAVMLMSVALVAVLCVVAYKLAVYALPFMLGLTAAQFAYQTGSGVIGAGLVGIVSAGVSFGILALRDVAHSHPSPDRGADLRRTRRRRRLCAGAWHHQRGGAL